MIRRATTCQDYNPNYVIVKRLTVPSTADNALARLHPHFRPARHRQPRLMIALVPGPGFSQPIEPLAHGNPDTVSKLLFRGGDVKIMVSGKLSGDKPGHGRF